MTELNEEHFEVIDRNKVERYERQKLTYLEDRVKGLEKSIEGIHKILARFQMTEGKEYDFFDSPPTFVEVGDK